MSGHSALKVSEKSRQIYNAKRKKVINNRKIYICKREPGAPNCRDAPRCVRFAQIHALGLRTHRGASLQLINSVLCFYSRTTMISVRGVAVRSRPERRST